MKTRFILSSCSYTYRIAILFALILTGYLSQAQTPTVARVHGNLCVGSTNTFAFQGNCSSVTWQVAPSGMYTIISQSNSTLQVRWNVATGGARVTALYNNCSPSATGGTSTPNMSITGALTPSVSISVNGGSSTICAGASLSFTGSAVNGGSSPTYTWQVNNVTRQTGNGANARFFTWSGFNNGDVVRCLLTSVATGCITGNGATSNSITVTVNQPASVNVSIRSWGLPMCVGQTSAGFQLDGPPLNGTYNWYRNNNPVTDNSPTVPSFVYQPTVPLNNGDKVKLVFTPSGGCSTSTTSNTITATTTQPVQPLISVSTSLSLPATICAGTNITFTAGPATSGYSLSNYVWTLNGATISGNSSNTFSTTSYSQGSIVTVRATASGSCISSTTTNTHTTEGYPISVVPTVVPGVNLSSSTVSQCAGASITFTASPINGGSNPSYTWQVNGSPAPGSSNSNTYTTSSLSNGAVVKVIMTSNASCIAGGASATVEKSTPPITIIPVTSFSLSIADPGSFCGGLNNSFYATALDGGNGTYRWYLTRNGTERQVPDNERDMSSGYGYIFTPHQNFPLRNGDVIKCTFTSNRQCVAVNPVVSNSRTVSVTTPGAPLIAVEVLSHTLPVTVCAGQTFTFRAGPPAGANYSLSNYQWTLDGTPVSGNNTNTFSTSSYGQGSIVTVRATASGGCLSSTSTNTHTTEGYPIAVLPIVTPNVTLTVTRPDQCTGTSIMFQANPTNGGTNPTYSWQVNGAPAPGSTNSNIYTTSSLSNGDVVKVIMTSNAQCIAGSPTVERSAPPVTIFPITSFSLNLPNPGPFCGGLANTFYATALDGGNGTYRWYITRNGTERLVPDNERDMSSGYGYVFTPHQNFPLMNGDVVKCTFTSNRQCVAVNPVTSNSRTVVVTNPVNPLITVDVMSHNLPVTVCAGETFTFRAGPPTGAAYTLSNYQWTLDGAPVPNNNTNTFSTTSYNQGSIVTVKATASGSCISSNTTNTHTTEGYPIAVVPHFAASIDPSGTRVLPSYSSITITASPAGTDYSYTWYKDGEIIDDATGRTLNASEEGRYWVVVARSACKKTSQEFFLDKNNPPVANAGPDITLNFPVQYTWVYGSGTDSDGTIVSYEWTQLSGPEGYTAGNMDVASLYLNELPFGTYVFSLKVTDNSGDTDTDEVIITVIPPPNNYNLIKEVTVLVPEKAIGGVSTLQIANGQKSERWQYFDGIGRPMQTIMRQASPLRLDMVQPIVYDGVGREAKKYLPFTAQNNGWYKPNNEIIDLLGTEDYIGIAAGFYNNPTGKIADDNNKPFARSIFEPSPLNRIVKQGAAGAAWQPDGMNTYTSVDHTVKKTYEVAGPEVLRWTYTYPTITYPLGLINAGTANAPVTYGASELFKNKTKDEQNREVLEYTNKEGRLVLKRVQAVEGTPSVNNSNYASTYYIYDDHGNLVCVIPPEAVNRLATEYYQSGADDVSKNNFLQRWAFRYVYDNRNRIVQKQVPGAEPIYMVYDDRDRLVMTQDGNQRAGAEKYWTITKYDALNRPVLAGIYSNSNTLTQMQDAVNNYYTNLTSSQAWYETFTGAGTIHGYDNKSFPQITDPDSYLTVTYYDRYAFKSSWIGNYAYVNDALTQAVNGVTYNQPVSENLYVTGLITGSKIKVLDGGVTGGYTWLKTINYYDDKYRVAQIIGDNYKGGFDRTSNLYDFTGKILKAKTTHVERDIVWKDLVGVKQEGNKLIRTAAGTGWGPSGAVSAQQLPAGMDGWMEFQASETTLYRMLGLSDQNTNASYTTLDYAWYLRNNGTLAIYESGTSRGTFGAYVPGDVLKIERNGSTVRYYQNNILRYTSTVASSSALMVDAAFHAFNATIANVRTSFSETVQTINRRFEYDHAGRLFEAWNKVGVESEVLLARHEYNELGQLTAKKLHSEDTGNTFKQHIDYRFNIRGWLDNINDVENHGNDLFSLDLNYNDPKANGGSAQYNGNISQAIWKGPDAQKKSYGYYYDALNRLTDAKYFNVTESGQNGRFNEKIGDISLNRPGYDLNGNILNLFRHGKTGENGGVITYGLMDDLTYAYSDGNKLYSVTDNAIDTEGFKDGGNSDDDYRYDDNGNMHMDKNKNINTNGITYNYLNLPDRVQKSLAEYIQYIYDANGRKLSQMAVESGETRMTDYAGEFIYENDTLQFINHEEGRIVMSGALPEYQYHLKDHLGNVRVTFTTREETAVDKAGYETADMEQEQNNFQRYENARRVQSSLFDKTNGTATGYAQRLNGSANETIGLTKSLSVMPGDVVTMKVFAKYVDSNSANWTAALNALLTQISTNNPSIVTDGASYNTGTSNFPYAGLLNTSGSTGEGPKAYLNWLIFDRDYNFITGGYRRMSDVSREYGQDVAHEKLEAEITIVKAGYVYVYLSNENETLVDVFFDEFEVNQIQSPVVQTDDYYPFGLTFNSYARENGVDQKFKFQGQEHIADLDLRWDSFKWRNHQPDIGRFFNIDPLAEKYVYNSPYAFSENHVVAHRELEGLEKVLAIFYHGGPTGGGNTTTPEKAGTAGDIYKSTQAFAQSEGREFAGTVIAPGLTSASGVETAQEFINSNYVEGDQVIIYGYSYGVDNAMDLATNLGEQGIIVNTLVTVDGSDGPLQNSTVNTTVPDNVMNNLNIYQTSDSGSSSSSASTGATSSNSSSGSSSSNSGTSNFPGSNGGPNSPTPANQNKVIDNRNVTAPGVTHGNIQQKQQTAIQDHINHRIHNYYIPIQK